MNFKDIKHFSETEVISYDKAQGWINFFKQPFKEIEISPYVKAPARLSTTSSAEYHLISGYLVADSITAVPPNGTVREYYYGDYIISVTQTFATGPINLLYEEHVYNTQGAAYNKVPLKRRLVTVSDTVPDVYEAKDRLFNRLTLTTVLGAGDTCLVDFKFVGVRIILK